MTTRRGHFYFLLALALINVVISAGSAEAATPHRKLMRIFYYREGKFARESFKKNERYIDVLAPQAHGVTDQGVLEGSIDDDLLALASSTKTKVMPLVTNKGFEASTSLALLIDLGKQDTFLEVLIQEAQKYHLWGWQFDFEQMDASLRDEYSAFIAKAHALFQKNNLILSVAVVARFTDDPSAYPPQLWQNVIGVYDYAALGEQTDFITVMAYDDPDSPGPVAGLPWVKEVLAYTLSKIPKEKISLGLPLYYWKRDDATQKIVEIGGYEGIKNVLKKYKVKPGYSKRQRVPYLEFKKSGKAYTLWYENGRSLQEKIGLIRTYHLHGFSAWALGLEDPHVFSVFKGR